CVCEFESWRRRLSFQSTLQSSVPAKARTSSTSSRATSAVQAGSVHRSTRRRRPPPRGPPAPCRTARRPSRTAGRGGPRCPAPTSSSVVPRRPSPRRPAPSSSRAVPRRPSTPGATPLRVQRSTPARASGRHGPVEPP
ncbi:hypothetical protein BS78_K269800, partial [Paspalum vaginatum]